MTNQIVFVNGKSKCGCVMEYSDGGGEYSNVHRITPCPEHSENNSGGRIPLPQSVWDVAAERRRQITVEGWAPEHDDTHKNGELADYAAMYAMSLHHRGREVIPRPGKDEPQCEIEQLLNPEQWPDAPKSRRRELVIAGALILAEIERLDRAADITLQAQGGE